MGGGVDSGYGGGGGGGGAGKVDDAEGDGDGAPSPWPQAPLTVLPHGHTGAPRNSESDSDVYAALVVAPPQSARFPLSSTADAALLCFDVQACRVALPVHPDHHQPPTLLVVLCGAAELLGDATKRWTTLHRLSFQDSARWNTIPNTVVTAANICTNCDMLVRRMHSQYVVKLKLPASNVFYASEISEVK